MPAISKRSRNYSVLLVISLGIIGLVLYYLIIYIPENEQRINARHFRILQRIGTNFTTSIKNYSDRIAEGYGKQILEKHFADKRGKKDTNHVQLSVDEVNTKLKNLAEKDSIKERANGLMYVPDQEEQGQTRKKQRHTHIREEPEGTFLHFASRVKYDKKEPSRRIFTFDSPFYFHTQIRIDSLFVPLMRWDSFDYFAIFRKLDKDSAMQVVYYDSRFYHKSNLIDLLPSDSLPALISQTARGAPAEIAIAGESYKLFFLNKQIALGLIVQDHDSDIRIMNKSFRDFVRNVVDPAEALRYEKINAQSSSWDMYKMPLVLILIAGALFIFFTQKQTWVNIAAVLAAVSTIIGILPRLGVLLPAIFAGKEVKNN